MFDVITFGSATRDLFLTSKEFQILKDNQFITGQGFCISAGSKIYIDDLIFATGGGGTNTAATFSYQGLKTAYVGKVGDDAGGQAIVDELKELKIKDFVKKDKEKKTAYSVVLSVPQKERTILVYHGACHFLKNEDIPWSELKTRWFYLAPLSGECAELFTPIMEFAIKNNIKIAVNPGNSQLKMGKEILKPLLNKIDILILNQEEAAELTGLPFQNEKEVFAAIDELVPGIVVMSKGPEGVIVSDGNNLYSAGIPKSDLVDRTGAGDAFGSGFVSAIIQGKNIEYAIELGTANATAAVQNIGAKNDLLKKGEWGKWERVKVESKKL